MKITNPLHKANNPAGETTTPTIEPITLEQALEIIVEYVNQSRRVIAAWEGRGLAEEVNGLDGLTDSAARRIGYDYDPTEDPDTPLYAGEED